MAPNPKPSGLRSRVHFLFRLFGLAGLAVTLIGLQILFIVSGTISPETLRETATVWQERFQTGVFAGDDSLAFVAASLVVGGALVLLVVVLLDALILLRQVTALRTAAGLNLVVQVGLATALLVGINYFSFRNYARFDWTRNQQFTLPPDIENQLKQLQGQTTIVVYLPHQSLGQRTQNLDPETRAYISATEHQVVEKLKDAVAQFREFGQRFEVVVLDVEDWQHFKTKLDSVTKDHPELREAINQTPDNTIFFAGGGRVQRLSFNEFYQLDLVASKEQGNLVLVSQGVRPLARKVFHIDEKQPRIAIGVIHDILSTEGPGDYGMRGVKKALSSRGFDTRDVILKKSRGFSLVGPGVYTFAEGRYDRLSSELAILNRNLQTIESFRKRNLDIKNDFEKLPLPELNEKYARRLQVREITPQMKQLQLEELHEVLAEQQEAINDFTARRDTKAKELAAIQVDDVAEMQRMTDLQGKMNRLLADCDHDVTYRKPEDTIAAENPWGIRVDAPPHRLNRGELYNLSIGRGTLTAEERFIINDHMTQTIMMLQGLPFAGHLRSVPEIAGGHHERMDGTGFPKRLKRDEMSPVARMMAIADVFEALTAADRPYKKPMRLSQAFRIMANMKRDHHLDPDLLDLFVRAGVWRKYADWFLAPEQVDAPDINLVLDMRPR